ncbi:hypothetical protein [Caulobacter hibisci]|uniref:HTH cro/C1-type domain-containing protein n=1 Tax=Caulobacter hibisci TaxID=2035993 RepID=A0ABS0T4H1_9CAUL|nr:hypothetical protein [Caulobacter hibisci]MBI1686778.1 hypothetical protein [Caulobacter hibisci]
MEGKALVAQIRRTLSQRTGREFTDVALAAHLGLSPARLSQLKSSPALSALQVARLIDKVDTTAEARATQDLIKTVVEFHPIYCVANARGGVSNDLFDVMVDGELHPYRNGLRDELRAANGVYLFYDSRGRALYAGQAKHQSLWKEMNLAFNRDRGEVQALARVQHPDRRVEFRRSQEKRRQIVTRQVPLHEMAAYFSAYAIAPSMIDDLEALLIRAFPNDLLNKKRENLGKATRK